MTDIKYILKKRSSDATLTAPLASIKGIYDITDDAMRGQAFRIFFDKVSEAGEPWISDIEHLKGIVNWFPGERGLSPIDMMKRLPLAEKIIKVESSKSKDDKYILLSSADIQAIKAILNNDQFALRPSLAFYGFILDLQEAVGVQLYDEESDEKEGEKKSK